MVTGGSALVEVFGRLGLGSKAASPSGYHRAMSLDTQLFAML
jgi:hypothetical protein